jgi:hypothetical protein
VFSLCGLEVTVGIARLEPEGLISKRRLALGRCASLTPSCRAVTAGPVPPAPFPPLPSPSLSFPLLPSPSLPGPQGNPADFAAYLEQYRNTICGRHPIGVFLNVGGQGRDQIWLTGTAGSNEHCWCRVDAGVQRGRGLQVLAKGLCSLRRRLLPARKTAPTTHPTGHCCERSPLPSQGAVP